jgi:hypothetical protein
MDDHQDAARGRACIPASPQTTNRPSRCRSAPCGNTPPIARDVHEDAGCGVLDEHVRSWKLGVSLSGQQVGVVCGEVGDHGLQPYRIASIRFVGGEPSDVCHAGQGRQVPGRGKLLSS